MITGRSCSRTEGSDHIAVGDPDLGEWFAFDGEATLLVEADDMLAGVKGDVVDLIPVE